MIEAREVFEREIKRWKNYTAEVKIVNRKNALTKLMVNPRQKKAILILPKRLENISQDILIGLIDSLILRFDRSFEADIEKIKMYNEFVKYLSESYSADEQDNELKKIFDKINKTYFNNLLEDCNLKWSSKENLRTMGTYNLNNNTITISRTLKDADPEVIEFVMYHEMLHKLLKFKGTLKKTYHSKEFRTLENQFPNKEEIERKIQEIIKRKYKEKKHWF